ncbi:MAG: SulP family inorganic anion transporter [Actinobacteria bacterium]|jgi:high affinity sulfate transporter 1|nr:MAG: SulP family inorganic anion transporter [Actinomycetota bacterium]
MTSKAKNGGKELKGLLPVFAWLPAYRRRWLVGDITAGITTWAATVPIAMAFAGIAGVPVQYGLYAACLSLIAYAVFGTSRVLHVGPTAAIAAVSAATVTSLAGGDMQRYIALTTLLAFIVGLLLVLAGLARAGFIAKLLAKPVLEGYVVGAAIFIAVGQAHKLFGIQTSASNTFAEFADLFRQAGSWSWTTLAVGAGCLLLLFALHRLFPRLPVALTVLALSIVMAYALDLAAHGIALVGEVPRGLSWFSLSGTTAKDAIDLLPGAVGLALLAFAESLAIARALAGRHRREVRASQEMIALGAANLGAGLLQGFAVDASFTRTAISEQAGGKTQLASVICSALVFSTLFLTSTLKYLPQATLGAIVIFAVSRLIVVKPFARLRRASRADYALALCALFGVLIFGVMVGILIGVALSLAGLILRTSRPHSAVLGVDDSGTRHGDLAERPDCKPYTPYLIIYRFDAPLIFSNVDQFVDDIRRLVEEADPRPRAVIVDFEMVYEMDTSASDEFTALHAALHEDGVEMLIARVHAPVRAFMQRDGITDMVGAENIFYTVRDAVQAFRERHPGLLSPPATW